MNPTRELPYDRIVRTMRKRWPSRWPPGSKIPQTAVAKLAGVSQPSVSAWIKGGPIKHPHAIDLAMKLGVAVEWLETGRGPEYPLTGDILAEHLWSCFFVLQEHQRMELVRYAEFLRSSAQANTG